MDFSVGDVLWIGRARYAVAGSLAGVTVLIELSRGRLTAGKPAGNGRGLVVEPAAAAGRLWVNGSLYVHDGEGVDGAPRFVRGVSRSG